jgi:hypothetical protein
VERLFQLHVGGRYLDLQLWTMLSFVLWCQRFLPTADGRDVAPARTHQALGRRSDAAVLAAAH